MKRKEFNNLKKITKKELKLAHKIDYEKRKQSITKLPKKERVAARKSMKSELKAKYNKRLKEIPSIKGKKFAEIERLLEVLKKLKW